MPRCKVEYELSDVTVEQSVTILRNLRVQAESHMANFFICIGELVPEKTWKLALITYELGMEKAATVAKILGAYGEALSEFVESVIEPSMAPSDASAFVAKSLMPNDMTFTNTTAVCQWDGAPIYPIYRGEVDHEAIKRLIEAIVFI